MCSRFILWGIVSWGERWQSWEVLRTKKVKSAIGRNYADIEVCMKINTMSTHRIDRLNYLWVPKWGWQIWAFWIEIIWCIQEECTSGWSTRNRFSYLMTTECIWLDQASLVEVVAYSGVEMNFLSLWRKSDSILGPQWCHSKSDQQHETHLPIMLHSYRCVVSERSSHHHLIP